MPIPNTHPLLQAANHVDGFDLGTGGADGFTADSAVAVRQSLSDSDNDFDFAQPGQGSPRVAPVTARAIASPAPEPAQETSPKVTQAPPQPSRAAVAFGITPPIAQVPPFAVYAGTQQQARDFAGTLGEAPARDDAHRHPFLARALKSPKVKAALKSAQTEQAAYRLVLKNTGPLIGSEQQAVDLLAKIANSTDITELESLRHKYAECFGDAARAAAQSARRICRVAYAKLDAALHKLIDVTIAELDGIAPEIESKEVDLFDSFGFPHQRTGLMSHLHHIRGRVAHHKAALELNAGPERVNTIIPGAGEEVLDTFTA